MTPIRRIAPWLLFITLFFMAPWVSHAADRAAPALQTGVRISIDSVIPGQEAYRINLNIIQPNRIQRVVMLLENDAGTLVLTREANPGNNTSLSLDFPTAAMTDAGTYRIKIRAVDLLGNFVEREGDNVGQDEEPNTLAQREIEFLPDSNRLTFSVLSVNPDYNADRIVVALQIADESRVLSYQGFIRNDNGQSIMQIPETIYTRGGTIVLSPIPPAMRNATSTELSDAATFQLHLQLITQTPTTGRNVFDLDEPFEFATVPPPPPGMMERIMTTMTTNPTVPTLIIFVIGAVVVFFIMRNRKPAPDLPTYRPPVDQTVEIYGSNNAALRQASYAPPATPVRRMRLRMRVIESPGMQPNTEQIIDTFPYVLGRGLWLNDPQMSREHATITMRSGQFYITDNNSRNGTTVRDVSLTADKPSPLEGSTIVKLGLNSMLEIEPYG